MRHTECLHKFYIGFSASLLIRILTKKNFFRKSLAASELEKQKETMKQILAEAEKELEQGASPLKQQQEQEEQEKVEEKEEENVEEEEEEVRRASVSTVELDDTETHILPSASFLGRYLHNLFSVSVFVDPEIFLSDPDQRIPIVLNKGQGGQIIRVRFRILPRLFMVIEKKNVVK